MGASLAAACRGERLWCSDGRSTETGDRAAAAGMNDVGSVEELVRRSDMIDSICPPSAAVDTARLVSGVGFSGIYVDANAVAPSTARAISHLFPNFVDGAVIGPPVNAPGVTRMYLSGTAAELVARRWHGSALETRIIVGDGAASALKICYASWTKVSAAMLLAIRALAAAEGVEAALLEEWSVSLPHLPDDCDRAAHSNSLKAWRFVGEMEEIAAAYAARGLPDGFGAGARDVYARLSIFKGVADASLAEVVSVILDSAERQ